MFDHPSGGSLNSVTSVIKIQEFAPQALNNDIQLWKGQKVAAEKCTFALCRTNLRWVKRLYREGSGFEVKGTSNR